MKMQDELNSINKGMTMIGVSIILLVILLFIIIVYFSAEGVRINNRINDVENHNAEYINQIKQQIKENQKITPQSITIDKTLPPINLSTNKNCKKTMYKEITHRSFNDLMASSDPFFCESGFWTDDGKRVQEPNKCYLLKTIEVCGEE